MSVHLDLRGAAPAAPAATSPVRPGRASTEAHPVAAAFALGPSEDPMPSEPTPPSAQTAERAPDGLASATPVALLDPSLLQALGELVRPARPAGAAGVDSGADGVGAVDETAALIGPGGLPGLLISPWQPAPTEPTGTGPSGAPASAQTGRALQEVIRSDQEPVPAAMPAIQAPSRSAAPLLARAEGAGMAFAVAEGAQAGGSPLLATSPLASSEASAWLGLQRWSGELMAAAPAPAAQAAHLALPADSRAWQQPLLQALGDRLQLQIASRSEQARLHLAPPQLGRIEIDIRQQGGALQVQLSASHDEVRQQLRQISEPLRHELVQRHSGEVSVQVSAGAETRSREGSGRETPGQSAQGQAQREAQRQPGRALSEDEGGSASASFHQAFAGLI